jgi:hypothetical protein
VWERDFLIFERNADIFAFKRQKFKRDRLNCGLEDKTLTGIMRKKKDIQDQMYYKKKPLMYFRNGYSRHEKERTNNYLEFESYYVVTCLLQIPSWNWQAFLQNEWESDFRNYLKLLKKKTVILCEI